MLFKIFKLNYFVNIPVLPSESAIISGLEQHGVEPELLMVGIMTTGKYLSTRACTVYNTWAKHIEGN